MRWLPDGKRFLATARQPGHPARTYLFDGEGGAPQALTPEGYRGAITSPDGKRLYTYGPDQGTYVFSLDGTGGEPVKVPGIDVNDGLAGWAPDGRLYVRKGNSTRIPAPIVLLDPATGKQEPWRELVPADATGINALQVPRFLPNGAYAYGYFRSLSNLYLVEGLK